MKDSAANVALSWGFKSLEDVDRQAAQGVAEAIAFKAVFGSWLDKAEPAIKPRKRIHDKKSFAIVCCLFNPAGFVRR